MKPSCAPCFLGYPRDALTVAPEAPTWTQAASYDRSMFDRIRLALDSASPPSLSAIAKAEDLSKQTIFRLKQAPQAALAAFDAWGL
jgi:hypothetical protein